MPVLEEVLGLIEPAMDFEGSFDFIRGLPSRRGFSVRRSTLRRGRNLALVSNILGRSQIGPEVLLRKKGSVNKSDFTDAVDLRRWHPSGRDRAAYLDDGRQTRVVVPEFDPDVERRIRRITEKAKRQLTPGFNPFKGRSRGRVRAELAPSALAFEFPDRTVICLKRRIRREVLHAFGIAGRAARFFSAPRRHWYSGVIC